MFNRQALARHWGAAKKVIGDSWHTRIGQGLDHSVRVGRKLLGAVSPLLDQLGGGHHMKPLMQGITAYDQGRADVMHGVNNVQTHLARIRRHVPEIDI
jgi:hypothetical protein